jgi:hypothetical protein
LVFSVWESVAEDRAVRAKGGAAWPEADGGLAAVEGDGAGAIAIPSLAVWWKAEGLKAEERGSLPLPEWRAPAGASGANERLVRVAEEMRGEAAGGIDLGVGLVARRLVEPVRSLVGEEEAGVVRGEGLREVVTADGLGLAQIPGEAALIVACGELQEGGVEADQRDAAGAGSESCGEVAGQDAGRQTGRAEGGAAPPVVVVGEGGGDDAAVFARWVGIELVLDLGEASGPEDLACRGGRLFGVRAQEVVVAGNGDEDGVAGAELMEFLPERRQDVGLEGLELFGEAGLGQVAGEEHGVPRSAAVVKFLEISEERLADVGPERVLAGHAVMQIREM